MNTQGGGGPMPDGVAGRGRPRGARERGGRGVTANRSERRLATYEATKPDGGRFRNTEILTFDADDRVARVEVYFGWDLPA